MYRGADLLVSRIKSSQNSASKSLLQLIDDLMIRHRTALTHHLGVSSTDYDDINAQLWRRLAYYSPDTIHQDLETWADRDARLTGTMKAVQNTSKHQRFIKELYPVASSPINLGRSRTRHVIDWTSMLTKYTIVDHRRLYNAYRDLDEPAILQLSSAELEKLLHDFLFGARSFKKPNAILKSFVETKPEALVTKAFYEMIDLRKAYLDMVLQITCDMRDAGIRLLNKERCGVLYMTLFRDFSTIVGSVEGAHASYNDFLVETYTMMIDKFIETNQLSTDLLNTMLFHAISRDNTDIIRDILAKFGLDDYAGAIKKPNLQTFKLIIDYFGRKQLKNSLLRVMDMLSVREDALDISIVNKCISATVCCGEIEVAHRILTSILSHTRSPQDTGQGDPTSSEAIMYKQLSFQDRRLYMTLSHMHQSIGEITGTYDQFIIYPTIDTFMPLINYYCKNTDHPDSLHHLHELLTIMTETCKLPLDTRTYQHAFKWHLNSTSEPTPLEWEILLLLTTRLIIDHDNLYNMTRDTSYLEVAKLTGEMDISGPLQHFLNSSAASLKTTPPAPTWAGNFVKLSDTMIDCVYEAYIETLSRIIYSPYREDAPMLPEEARRKKDAIVRETQELRAQLEGESTRRYSQKAHRHDLHQLDEYTLMKKEYLLLLVDIADAA